MKEKIISVLESHFKENNEILERLKNLLKEVEEDKKKILEILMEFNKDEDFSGDKNLLDKLFKDMKTKNELAPDLNHLLIINKLYFEIEGQNIEKDPYAFEVLGDITKEHFPNLLKIVEQSEEALGYEINLKDKDELLNLLKQYELNEKEMDEINSNSNKGQENAISEEIQRQDFEALRKSLDNALKDIQEMNCMTIKEYYFASAEIEWIKQELENKNESYTSEKFPRTSELIKLIESRKELDPEVIKAFDEMKSGKDVKRNILVLKKRICGIDFHELFRMLAEAREFQKEQMEMIGRRNKNKKKIKAVSFFGLSKVGKSTLIKGLMGYKMKMTQINGINTIQVSNPEEIRPEHENLKIGASNKSTTRIPRLYLLPTNNLEQESEDIYLFDCPGAEDSESIEVEISNRITTIEALREVGELYIAIVLSEKIQGLNGEGYEKLARAVDGFVKNYREIKESILLIFNGGSEEYLETFYHNIQDIRNNIKDRNNYALSENFEAFFDHMESQSKKRKQMFVVDPLKLEAKEFVEEIPTRSIRNCEDVLDGRLGERCDKELEESISKLKVGFDECFENDDIDGASYYFAILHKIASEKKIALYAGREIITIKEQMIAKMEENISDFKKEIENLKILRMKKEEREIEMKKLKAKYEKIKKNLQKMSAIKEESLENKKLREELYQKLSDIIQDTETWFLNEMQKWKSENFDLKEVSEITEIFIEFLQCFSLSKKKFENNVEEIKGEILSEMNRQYKKREKNHKMYSNLSKLQSIQKLINPTPIFPLVGEIKGEFEKLKKSISIIKWDYMKNIEGLKEDVMVLKGKSKGGSEEIDEFLTFIALVKEYPEEMKDKFEDEMIKDENYLLKSIPEYFINKLIDAIGDNEEENKDEDIKKITFLQGVIKSLKFLDNIETIRIYQNNRISENFHNLEEIIEKGMQKIEKIKEAFKKDKINEIKEDLKKVTNEIKRIKDLANATEKKEIEQKICDLDKSLNKEIEIFIERNKFSERIVLSRSDGISKSILKINKLIEFKEIFKFTNDKTKELLNNTILEGEKKIIEPIKNYTKKLEEENTFSCNKVKLHFDYYEVCKGECETIDKSNLLFELVEAISELIEVIKKIYISTVEGPVKELKEVLLNYQNKEMNNEFKKLSSKGEKISEFKTALKKLYEMGILNSEELDLNTEENKKEFEEVFNDLTKNLITKVERQNLDISDLNELEEIVWVLKEIERSFLIDTSKDKFQVKELYEKMNGQKANFKKTQKEKIQCFERIKATGDIEKFDSNEFYTTYKEFEKDKSLAGISNMKIFKEFLEFYLRNAEKKCERYTSEIEGNPLDLGLEHQQYYTESLITITDIMAKLEYFKQYIPGLVKECELNFKSFEAICKNLIDEIVKSLMSFCDELEKEIYRSKNKDIIRKENFLRTVNQNMVKISQFENKKKLLESYDNFKKTRNFKCLNEIIKKMVDEKKEKLEGFVSGNKIKILKSAKSGFNDIYSSLDNEQNESKEEIKKKLRSEIASEKEEMKREMTYKYEEFDKRFKEFCENIKSLPHELEKQHLKDIQDIEALIKLEEEKMKEQIKILDIDSELKETITLAIRLDELGNPNYIELFVNFTKMNVRKPKPLNGYFKYLKNEIWENKINRDNLKELKLETLKEVFNDYQLKLTELAEKELLQKWTNIEKYRSSGQNNDAIMSPSQSLILSSIFIEEKKIESSIDYIKDCYHSLCKETKKNTNQNYENMKKITEEKTNELLIEMKEVIKQTEINKNYDFLSEEKGEKFFHLKEILKLMVSKTKFTEFSTKFEKEIEELLQKYETFEKIFSNIVQENLDINYEFYSEKLKNLTDQEIEKYVETIEANFCFLSSIQNVYNNYFRLDQNREIRMEEIIKDFQSQMNKAEKEHEQALTTIFDNLNESVNGKIGFIPKIFDKLNSIKKKALFSIREEISNQQKAINEKISKKICQQKAEVEKCTNELLSCYENFSDKYNKQSEKIVILRESEFTKIYESYEKTEKELKAKYYELAASNKEEEKNIKDELEAELSNNKNNKEQKENEANLKEKDELNRFIQKQDKELREKCQIMAKSLIKCKKMQHINETTQKELEKCLEASCKKIIKNSKLGKKFFEAMISLENNFASILIAERNEFAKFRNAQFQELTEKTNNEEEIINPMFQKSILSNKQVYALTEYYQKFNKIQKEHIECYQKTGDRKIISYLSSSIKEKGKKLKDLIQKSQEIRKESKVELLAEIFALWSISSSEKEKSCDGSIFICFRAHAAQVICILILIAIESEETRGQIINKNRLAEVKTGEGKSIVLAMLSIYFALCGYEVDCICYSSILSKRDQSDFEDLFKKCGVESKISYGVFEVAIKKILNQQDGENKVNVTFEEFILKSVTSEIPISDFFMTLFDKVPFLNNLFKSFRESFGKKLKNKILIIDEIDVLFNKKYFGDTFNLSIDLRDESITTLLQFIWTRKDNITAKLVLDSSEFREVTNKFKALAPVLKNQVYGMILALKTYKEEQNYVIKDQTIYYKVEDQYSSDVSYRYNTTYLYFEEFEKNRVSQSALMKNMVINICVAEFSYACILEYYTHILGVTGTLTCLPEYIKEFMENNFGILKSEQKYVIPSVYGKNEKKKIESPICTSRENYYDEIIQNIKEVFEKDKRPILIFFKSKAELINFYNSEKYSNWQKFTFYFTEEHSEKERNDRIYKSSFKNSITLMTETFIRGTDFKLIDKSSEKAGGFHAIVTYLIDNTADYIQAMGRVGRQGKPGSFIEIFMKDDFEFLGLENSEEEIPKIRDARERKQESEKESILERIKVSKKKNDDTIAVFQDKSLNLSNLVDYIKKNNFFPEVTFSDSKIKMIFLIDATGSMGNLFVELKLILPQIFEDVYTTLEEKNVKGCLELQILQYRNYNSPAENLLECSNLEIQAENLKKFIDKSGVSGGWGNEALEVALQYVNTLREVKEIFLFGDARGNTKEEVTKKRADTKQYEKERLEKGFIPTTTEEELDILVRNKICVNTFCLSNTASVKEYFKNLSDSTQGKYSQIELEKKTSSMLITTTIVERVLAIFGEKNGGSDVSNALLQEYKKILSKRMSK